jgi:hypothetical protein
MAVNNQYKPESVSNYSVVPAYLGNQNPTPIQIKPSNYEFTDPIDFAKTFGKDYLDAYLKNFGISSSLGLDQLSTELKGLQAFAPQAAALKRSQLTVDNLFNQLERTTQVNRAMPNARGDLTDQRNRALSYTKGSFGDAIDDSNAAADRASNAADLSFRGGFGAESSVARKTSALMSAKEKFALSQQGEALLTQNMQTEANLFLAPTSYSNAGQSINVTPEVGAGRASSAIFGDLNTRNNIDLPTALQNKIQQGQWNTGRLDNINLANVNNANQSNLLRFQYDTGYAAAVAGATQTGINTQVSISQQNEARKTFLDYMKQAQKNQEAGAWSKLLGTVLSIGGNVATGGASGTSTGGI